MKHIPKAGVQGWCVCVFVHCVCVIAHCIVGANKDSTRHDTPGG